MRYWEANKDTASKILHHMKEWDEIYSKARKLAKSVGATSRIYETTCFGGKRVMGFTFKDESRIDKAAWCRLRNTPDGWRPRAKSEISGEFRNLQSLVIADVMKVIGMSLFDGLHWRHPGVRVVGNTIYLTTPDNVNAKGCKRISDLQYERAVASARRLSKPRREL